ncbi:hypothetical protein A8B78_16900 [Jannaschia sp. EhC01]|nr:hypothetical protein A8B78_16900 [Jannaschia sp. EhC01]
MDSQLTAFRERMISKERSGTGLVLFAGERTEFVKFRGRLTARYRVDEFSGDPEFFNENEYKMLMVYVSYRLASDPDQFGFELRMFGIDPSNDWNSPWGHTIKEYSHARTVG